MSILLFTVNSIMPVIILILLGYILKRIGFFTKEFLKIGNKTVFYVCLPVLLFKNISDIDDLSVINMDVVSYILVVIIVLFAVGGFLATLIKDPRKKGVIHQCVFRSNFALIGVPLAELMGGADGVRTAAVLSLFSIPAFNILAVIALSVYKDGKVRINIKKIVTDVIKNPLIRGILLGFAFVILKVMMQKYSISNPFSSIEFPYTVISYISKSATPLALLVLGGQFEFDYISEDKFPIFLGLFGRNILAPLVGVGIAALLTLNGKFDFGKDVFSALIALFGTPVAVASAIMAEAMDNDGNLAGQLVVWTSLVSLFSLFIIIFVVRALGLL